MIPIIFTLFGLVLGWFRASKAGKGTLDRLQYAVAHGFAFGLLGLILAVIYVRMSI